MRAARTRPKPHFFKNIYLVFPTERDQAVEGEPVEGDYHSSHSFSFICKQNMFFFAKEEFFCRSAAKRVHEASSFKNVKGPDSKPLNLVFKQMVLVWTKESY